MKKIILLILTNLFVINVFSQMPDETKHLKYSESYQIVDSLRDKNLDKHDIKVYSIDTIVLDCPKYENIEVESNEYKVKSEEIQSLIIERDQFKINYDIFLKDRNNFYATKKQLEDCLKNLKKPSFDSYFFFNSKALKKAQICLDSTSQTYDLYRNNNKISDYDYWQTEAYLRNNIGKIQTIINAGEILHNNILITSKKIDSKQDGIKCINRYVKMNKQKIGLFNKKIIRVDTLDVSHTLNGRYIEVNSGGLKIMPQDSLQFVKNEIVEEDSLELFIKNAYKLEEIANRMDSPSTFIIKDINTGKMYLSEGDIFEYCCISGDLFEQYKFLEEKNIKREVVYGNGLKTYNGREFVYGKDLITYNGNHCYLTNAISEELKKNNFLCIKNMQEKVEKYKSYMDVLSKYSSKLNKHRNAFNHLTMTKERMAEWKNDVKAMNIILEKIHKLDNMDNIYYQLDDATLISLHLAYMNDVEESEHILGL